MATLLLMPAIATGDDEATLTSWEVPVGSPFKASDTIAVIETAKAAVEVPAEADGVILKFLVDVGADVAVGNAIALVGAPGENVGDIAATLAELGVTDGVVGTPPPAAAEVTDLAPDAALPAVAPGNPPVGDSPMDTPDGSGSSVVVPSTGRLFASPLARRLAREGGLELAELVGTGPNGRINRDDVKAALVRRRDEPAEPVAAPGSVAAPAASGTIASRPGHVDVPHSRLRRAIARRLTESVTTAPHFTVSGVARVDRLLALRTEINDSTKIRISVNDLIVKAVATAHSAVPAMNVIWTPDAVRQFSAVDIGIAVTTPTGLVAPVLRGVDRLSVGEIGTATKELVARARENRLAPADLEGGSVSVSNLGMFGTRSFTAIINPPHASILAVGAAAPEPVVVDGVVSAATVLHLAVSVDHRPVDGATAAEWMRELIDVLEHPLGLLV